MSELADAVGIGPSALYRHFAGKQDVLATVLAGGLDSARDLVWRLNLTDRSAAAAGLAAYALDQRHLGLMWQREARDLSPAAYRPLRGVAADITDIDHLPDGERHAIRRAQRDFVSEWVHLLRLDQPQLDPTAARIRVHAALSVANDIARTSHLRRDPAVPAAVETICTRLLGLPEAGEQPGRSGGS
jgi:AcrR family transcriptional regulator